MFSVSSMVPYESSSSQLPRRGRASGLYSVVDDAKMLTVQAQWSFQRQAAYPSVPTRASKSIPLVPGSQLVKTVSLGCTSYSQQSGHEWMLDGCVRHSSFPQASYNLWYNRQAKQLWLGSV